MRFQSQRVHVGMWYILKGPKGFPCTYFKTQVYPIYLHGPFGSGSLTSKPYLGLSLITLAKARSLTISKVGKTIKNKVMENQIEKKMEHENCIGAWAPKAGQIMSKTLKCMAGHHSTDLRGPGSPKSQTPTSTEALHPEISADPTQTHGRICGVEARNTTLGF